MDDRPEYAAAGGDRARRSAIPWLGLFFIVLGAVPLAVRGGLLTADAAATAWRLWPLILVGIGIGILLRGRTLAMAGGLIVALTSGLIGGGLIAGGLGDLGSLACGEASASGPVDQRNGTLDASARVSLDQRCGDLNVTIADGAGWTLASSGGTGAPVVTASSTDVRVQSNGRRVFVFPARAGRASAGTSPCRGRRPSTCRPPSTRAAAGSTCGPVTSGPS